MRTMETADTAHVVGAQTLETVDYVLAGTAGLCTAAFFGLSDSTNEPLNLLIQGTGATAGVLLGLWISRELHDSMYWDY